MNLRKAMNIRMKSLEYDQKTNKINGMSVKSKLICSCGTAFQGGLPMEAIQDDILKQFIAFWTRQYSPFFINFNMKSAISMSCNY
jgi:hypothetical protein